MSGLLLREVLIVLLAYFLGAIPFSHLVARRRAGIDIRDHGEGNVGARNVFHVVGPRWGLLAGVLDVGKGLAAFLVGSGMAGSQTTVLLCGVAAPLGHGFSPFLRFRGGKGVATTLGFLLGFTPLPTLAAGVWVLLVYLVTRDANSALNFGLPGVVLMPVLLGQPAWFSLYIVGLFLVLALKKIVDGPHERAIWASDPWDSGRPGFYPQGEVEAEPELEVFR
jgi:glycerol-3-phosphate acyltransferase PlsY